MSNDLHIARLVWEDAMADPAFVAALHEAQDDIAAGRTYKWSDVKAGRCGERMPSQRERTCQRPNDHPGRHRYSA